VPASPFVPAGEELDGSMRFRRPPTLWLREAPHPDRQDRQRGARLPLRSAVRRSSGVLSVLYIFVKIGSAALIYLRCSSAARFPPAFLRHAVLAPHDCHTSLRPLPVKCIRGEG
jgi:hypothetical protein